MSEIESYAVWSTDNADWYSIPDMGRWTRAVAIQVMELDKDERPELELEVRPYKV